MSSTGDSWGEGINLGKPCYRGYLSNTDVSDILGDRRYVISIWNVSQSVIDGIVASLRNVYVENAERLESLKKSIYKPYKDYQEFW